MIEKHVDRGDDPAALAAALLACPADQRAGWIAAHQDRLNLPLIDALKRYSSDRQACADPIAADDATRLALLVAHDLPGESLAMPLARWARGNYEVFHDPQAAVQSYQQALVGYRAAGDALSVARLLSNLVFACCDSGRFAEAEISYGEARATMLELGDSAAFYLLPLEQNYGWLLHNRGRYDVALVTHERALELAYRLDRLDIAAEIEVNRAFTLGMIGRLAEAEAALLESRAVAEHHEQSLTVARIDMNLGVLYATQGRPAKSLRRFQTASEQFAVLGNQMEVGTVLLWEAMLFEGIGALREARRSYARAREQFTALQMRPWVGMALVRSAAVSRRYGAFDQAARRLAEADALWQALDQPVWCAEVVLEWVALALEQEDPRTALALLRAPLPSSAPPVLVARRNILLAEALTLEGRDDPDPARCAEASASYTRALSSARQSGDRWMERQALAGLGRLVLTGDPSSACVYLAAAADLDDLTRQALSVEEIKAGFQAQAGDLLPLLARLAIEQRQPLQGLAYAWRAKASAMLDLIQATANTQSPPAEQAEIDQVRQQIATYRWQAMLQSAGDAPESLRERVDPALRALEQRLHDLRRRRNRRPAVAGAAPATPTDVLGHMDADLLIEFFCCDDTIFALLASAEGDCRAVRLAEVTELLDLLDIVQLSFQNVLLHPQGRAWHQDAWLAESRALLKRCYDLLIAPLAPLVPGARLLIALCDPLYSFPFAAFWDGERYLVERHEVQMIPSGALLAVPPVSMPAAPPLVIAAPSEGRLAAVAAEAVAIQAVFPDCTCLVDDPHTLAHLRGLSVPPQIVHIAAHSVVREDAPIFSALRLPDGLLSVEQCYELPLRGTDLVTLSGCLTAGGLDSGGALLAFQSALFVAGVRQVVSSLWPIDDATTAVWMGHFYRFLAAGLAPSAALRATQQAMLADPAYTHPTIWAAFTCSRR